DVVLFACAVESLGQHDGWHAHADVGRQIGRDLLARGPAEYPRRIRLPRLEIRSSSLQPIALDEEAPTFALTIVRERSGLIPTSPPMKRRLDEPPPFCCNLSRRPSQSA